MIFCVSCMHANTRLGISDPVQYPDWISEDPHTCYRCSCATFEACAQSSTYVGYHKSIRLAQHLSINAYSFKARLSMAVPDAKVHFRLSTGTVTVPHITAAGEDVQLLVAAEHWLHVVSGGLWLSAARSSPCESWMWQCFRWSSWMSPCWAGPSDLWRHLSERRQKSFKNAWMKACHGLFLAPEWQR